MTEMDKELNGALGLALKIFRNSYSRKFFHKLVSSQLDIDRLDYLKRDCFFTGVQEGTIGVDRIISMLHVDDDRLVVEEKGIYSIENFLNARRLMYWQVYLHKTTVSAERMIVNIVERAKALYQAGENIQGSKALLFFLTESRTIEQFKNNKEALSYFGSLDDNDIWGAIKLWQHHPDKVLSILSKNLLTRNLFQIQLGSNPIDKKVLATVRVNISREMNILKSEASYLISHGVVSNEAYTEGERINIRMKDGSVVDIAQASDLPNITALSKIVKKNYLCWPKNVSL
jgi:HD superfamily phosphohydrolase